MQSKKQKLKCDLQDRNLTSKKKSASALLVDKIVDQAIRSAKMLAKDVFSRLTRYRISLHSQQHARAITVRG